MFRELRKMRLRVVFKRFRLKVYLFLESNKCRILLQLQKPEKT